MRIHSSTLHVILWRVEYVLQQIGFNCETGPFIHPYYLLPVKTQIASNDQLINMFDVNGLYFKDFITMNHIPYACSNILRFIDKGFSIETS